MTSRRRVHGQWRGDPAPAGFALIELVVVIGMIILLVSVVTPKFTQIRDFAGRPHTIDVTMRGPAEPADTFDVDGYLDRLELGAVAFNVPDTVAVKRSFVIRLLLALSTPPDSLAARVSEPGDVVADTTRIAPLMSARLGGTAFEIEGFSPEQQLISRTRRTEWLWKVVPQDTGEQRLFLTLTAHIDADGKEKSRSLRTLDRTIIVHAVEPPWYSRLLTWFVDNLNWIVPLIFSSGGLTLVYRWWKSRPARESTVAATSTKPSTKPKKKRKKARP